VSNWLTRPGYIAALAFLAGAAIAGAIVLVIWQLGGDDGGSDDGNGTPAATSTPAATEPAGTPAPSGTTTPAATEPATTFADPDEALAAYVERELEGEYGGLCSAGPPVGSYCASDLERGADLVTVLLGLANSEFFLEVVVTHNEDGTWSVDAFTLPDPSVPLSVGAEAIVHEAGTCLNFRAEPGLGSDPVTCQLDGTRGAVIDGPVSADDITWWNIEGYGWASEEFLGVAGE